MQHVIDCLCVCVLFTQDEDMPTADAPSAPVTAHPVAERLDSLMVVLMAYVKDASHLNGSSKTQQIAQTIEIPLYPFILHLTLVPNKICKAESSSISSPCPARLSEHGAD